MKDEKKVMKSYFLFTLLFASFPALALECDLKSQSELGNEVLQELEITPITCQPNSVHLTFDDGPNGRITPVLLEELAKRNVKASFFVTTSNLVSSNPEYQAANRAIVLKTMNAGHLIANHGHEHNAYCLRMKGKEVLEEGFDQAKREQQIKKSVELLQWSTGGKYKTQQPLLFRFPYGRGAMPSENELAKMMDDGEINLKSKNKSYSEQLAEYRRISPPLQTLAGANLSHLGWNHDSGDSSFGVRAPEKDVIKKYIIKNLKGLCSNPKITKVALFHDIKEMNMSAIPIIMDIGKCLGLKFISAQEMVKDKNLNTTGVLIDKQDVLKGVVENVIDTLKETNIKTPNQCEKEVHKNCLSENKRTYQHCQGEDSVCFDGKWLAKMDPIIINNCK